MLQADHDHARKVARGVNELETFSVDLERVQSNFVIVSIEDSDLDAATVVEALRKKDILVSAAGKRGLRFVFSRQVDGEMTETILETMQKLWA
jgi:threonine aldolase